MANVVSFTDIANMALGYVGGGRITNLDDDPSADADLVRLYFDISRRAELETYDWSFARKFQALPQASVKPTDIWLFAYVIPSDCLAARAIQKTVNAAVDKRIPYEIISSSDGEQSLVATNEPETILRYTFDQRNTAVYTTNFILAFSHRIASYIGYARTNKNTVRETQLIMAAQARVVAQGSDGNAGSTQAPEPSAVWTLDRER